MNPNFGARFVEDVTYIRYIETGKIFPFHEELTRSVREKLAEYIVFKKGKLVVIEKPVPMPEILIQIMQGLQRPANGGEGEGFTITPVEAMSGTVESLIKSVDESAPAVDLKPKKIS